MYKSFYKYNKYFLLKKSSFQTLFNQLIQIRVLLFASLKTVFLVNFSQKSYFDYYTYLNNKC